MQPLPFFSTLCKHIVIPSNPAHRFAGMLVSQLLGASTCLLSASPPVLRCQFVGHGGCSNPMQTLGATYLETRAKTIGRHWRLARPSSPLLAGQALARRLFLPVRSHVDVRLARCTWHTRAYWRTTALQHRRETSWITCAVGSWILLICCTLHTRLFDWF